MSPHYCVGHNDARQVGHHQERVAQDHPVRPLAGVAVEVDLLLEREVRVRREEGELLFGLAAFALGPELLDERQRIDGLLDVDGDGRDLQGAWWRGRAWRPLASSCQPRLTRRSTGPVDLRAVADADDENQELVVVDFVDDPVVPHPDAPCPLAVAREEQRAGRPRLAGQVSNGESCSLAVRLR